MLVAEQLRFDQPRRDRAAVHAYERGTGAPRSLVERARQHLFPAAGLPKDEHRHIGSGDVVDPIHHRTQTGLGADDRVGNIVAAKLAQQRLLVGLERFAQPLEFTDARRVRQRDSDWLTKVRQESPIRGFEWRAPRDQAARRRGALPHHSMGLRHSLLGIQLG